MNVTVIRKGFKLDEEAKTLIIRNRFTGTFLYWEEEKEEVIFQFCTTRRESFEPERLITPWGKVEMLKDEAPPDYFPSEKQYRVKGAMVFAQGFVEGLGLSVGKSYELTPAKGDDGVLSFDLYKIKVGR